MPEGYEKMRDSFMKGGKGKKGGKGLSRKRAEEKAAKIWNSKHKGGETVGRGRR